MEIKIQENFKIFVKGEILSRLLQSIVKEFKIFASDYLEVIIKEDVNVAII